MHMEISAEGNLTIALTDAELAGYGLDFASLDYGEEKTRTAVRALLKTAERLTGFRAEGPLLIEALPFDGGCLLLITPGGSHPRVTLRRTAEPVVYTLPDVDALLQLAAALPPDIAEASSLYRFGDGYRLVLYGGRDHAVLRECASRAGEGAGCVAYTAEHGDALCIGDALTRMQTLR